MPKFKLTLTKEFVVDTDDWEETSSGKTVDDNDNDDDNEDEDDDDEAEAGGNPLAEQLKAINADPANPTPEQLTTAMRACLADDLDGLVDFDEISPDDFAIELVDGQGSGRS